MARFLTVILEAMRRFGVELFAALGLSLTTYTGMNLIFQELVSSLQASFNSAPSAALQLFFLAGGGDLLNIVLSAYAFKLTLNGLTKLSFKGKQS